MRHLHFEGDSSTCSSPGAKCGENQKKTTEIAIVQKWRCFLGSCHLREKKVFTAGLRHLPSLFLFSCAIHFPPGVSNCPYVYIYIYIYAQPPPPRPPVLYIYILYGKCLGFARNRNYNRQRILIIIIIIIIIIKPLLKIFNECRSLTVVGELNPYRRSLMNVDMLVICSTLG